MTSPNRVAAKPLLDGQRIRWTLERVERETQQKVRIDWLRFTLPLDAVVTRETVQDPQVLELAKLQRHEREVLLACRIADASLGYTGAVSLAHEGAKQIASYLPVEVGQPEDKGLDYYSARCPLLIEGHVVGHVLAGSRDRNMAGTVHFNLHGEACLYVSPAKWVAVKEWIAASCGWITRVDLACDVWEGDEITHLEQAYRTGEFDVRGQRPKQSQAGAWTSEHSRTFYVGKRETGKLFRGYEKGDALFGPEANDPWIRYEVEIRNNARVIDLDVLVRPADYFAGAYPFCEALLERLDAQAAATRIPAGQKVEDKTAEAAVYRFIKTTERMFAPALCVLAKLPGDLMTVLFDRNEHRMPNRLRGHPPAQLSQAFEKVAALFAPNVAPSLHGA